MNTFVSEVRQTVIPGAMPKYGPLPPLLLGMTVVTGLVDAFSYLMLGHVFVANMTGNVVFLAFALGGVSGFSIAASLLALVAFVLGAFVAALVASRFGERFGHLLAAGTAVQALLLAAALAVIAGVSPNVGTGAYRYLLICLLAAAMGIQNATSRKLGVPDLTTTVLTMTITGLGADARIAGGAGTKAGRRLLSITAMFIGALVGVILIVHAQVVYPILIALVLTLAVAIASRWLIRPNPTSVAP